MRWLQCREKGSAKACLTTAKNYTLNNHLIKNTQFYKTK